MEKIVYDVKDIKELLGISKDNAYLLCKSGAFRVIYVGNHIKIPKESFHRWLDGENNEDVKSAE